MIARTSRFLSCQAGPKAAFSAVAGRSPSMKSSVDYSLYCVAYSKYFSDDMPDRIASFIRGGAGCILLNFKEQPTNVFVDMTKRILEVTRPLGVPTLVENNLEVCLAADADGLHVGVDLMDPAVARQHLGPNKILGVSTLGEEERLRYACDSEVSADYISCGGIAPSTNAAYPKIKGASHLRAVRGFMTGQGWSQPLIASGGIGPSNISETIQSGADGAMCVTSLFSGPASEDETRAREMREIIDRARAVTG